MAVKKEDLVTMEEAAEALGISKPVIYTRVRKQEIPAWRVNNKIHVKLEDVSNLFGKVEDYAPRKINRPSN